MCSNNVLFKSHCTRSTRKLHLLLLRHLNKLGSYVGPFLNKHLFNVQLKIMYVNLLITYKKTQYHIT